VNFVVKYPTFNLHSSRRHSYKTTGKLPSTFVYAESGDDDIHDCETVTERVGTEITGGNSFVY
jgi:hypothetical protein